MKASAGAGESTGIQCQEFETGARHGLYEKPCASASWESAGSVCTSASWKPAGSICSALSRQITFDTHSYLAKKTMYRKATTIYAPYTMTASLHCHRSFLPILLQIYIISLNTRSGDKAPWLPVSRLSEVLYLEVKTSWSNLRYSTSNTLLYSNLRYSTSPATIQQGECVELMTSNHRTIVNVQVTYHKSSVGADASSARASMSSKKQHQRCGVETCGNEQGEVQSTAETNGQGRICSGDERGRRGKGRAPTINTDEVQGGDLHKEWGEVSKTRRNGRVHVRVLAQMHANSKSAPLQISDHFLNIPECNSYTLGPWQLSPCFLHHQKCTTCIRDAKRLLYPSPSYTLKCGITL